MIRPLVFELMQNGLRVRQLDDFPRLNQQHLDSFVILMKNNDFELRYVWKNYSNFNNYFNVMYKVGFHTIYSCLKSKYLVQHHPIQTSIQYFNMEKFNDTK